MLKRFLQAHPEFSMEPFALSGLPEAPNGWLHLYPHEMRGEGHFVSRLRKSADVPAPQAEMPRMRPARPAKTAGKNASYCLLSFVYIRSEAFRVVIALSDQLILLHVRGIESSIFIDCFLFKAVQKYIKPLKDR